MDSGSIVYYHTPDEAIGILILIVVGLLLWIFLSVGSGGMDEEGDDESPQGLVRLPPPPGAAGLIGCSLKTWVIFIVLALAFLCMYTNTAYDPR